MEWRMQSHTEGVPSHRYLPICLASADTLILMMHHPFQTLIFKTYSKLCDMLKQNF